MSFIHLCYLLIILSISVNCDLTYKTRSKIYYDIQADKFCFRRLNATHQIGCSTYRGGAIGTIHLVDQESDIDWIIKDGPEPQYIATLTFDFFTKKHMQALKASNRVSGIIVLKDKTIPYKFSPEKACPNENFGLYSDSEYAHCQQGNWNLNNAALEMFYTDWNMPIFLVTKQKDIEMIVNCYKNFNEKKNETSWPLCSAQLESQMAAAKDTPTCMRRNNFTNLNMIKFCDPLGDKNIILPLLPRNKSEEIHNRSVVVVVARIDSFSMFDQLAPGAHSVVPSLISLVTVASLLANFKMELQHVENYKNIVFMILNGESFDYIGSSRVVFDMERGVFPVAIDAALSEQTVPLRLEHISHVLEMSQLGKNSGPVWIHTDPTTHNTNAESVHQLVELLTKDSIFKETDAARPLPPASVQWFLKRDPDIAGVVLADHDTQFTNRYYNSLWDNDDTLNTTGLADHIGKLALTTARALFQLYTGREMPQVTTDKALIEELLDCYVANSSCSIFQRLAEGATPPHNLPPYPLYVSVAGHKPNPITVFTHHLLCNLTGDPQLDRDKLNCTQGDASTALFRHLWVNGTCIKSTALLTEAVSPAFLLGDLRSTHYSTWTESVWSETSARIFVRPSTAHDVATLLTGILVLAVSLGTVLLAQKRATVLFGVRQTLC